MFSIVKCCLHTLKGPGGEAPLQVIMSVHDECFFRLFISAPLTTTTNHHDYDTNKNKLTKPRGIASGSCSIRPCQQILAGPTNPTPNNFLSYRRIYQ